MILHELRLAVRHLLRTPRFSIVVVATLAVALGGTGALFNVLHALVLRQLPVERPDRLVAVYVGQGQGLGGTTMPTLAELTARQGVVQDLCGTVRGSIRVVEVAGARQKRPAEGLTGRCYQLLGVQPFLGRLLADDDAPILGDAKPVAVISYRFWESVLGRDPNVIGSTLRVDTLPLTVIGVTPPGYHGLNRDEPPDLTLPLQLVWKLGGTATPMALHMVGRLEPGTSVEQARAHLKTLWPGVWKATNVVPADRPLPESATAAFLQVEPMATGFSTQRFTYEQPLYALVGLAALLLLLTSINVGGLFLARTIAREHELQVQVALGAGRLRLALQALGEGVILSVAAAGAALPLTWWISRAVATTIWTAPRPMTMTVDPNATVYAVIALATFIVGVVVSLPPIVLVLGRRWQILSGQDRSVFAATARWRRGQIVGQVAASLVLLFSAALFARNLSAIRSLEDGYDAANLHWGRLDLVIGAPRTIDQTAYLRQLIDDVSSIPQVSDVALSNYFPTVERRMMTVPIEFTKGDAPPGAPAELSTGPADMVSPGFFRTIGLPILQGRDFTWQDTVGRPRVAVINKTFAERMFPDGSWINRRVRARSRNLTVEVIGIAADASPGDRRINGVPLMYIPFLQEPSFANAPILLVRSAAGGILPQVSERLAQRGRHEIPNLQTIEAQTERTIVRERMLASLGRAFAALGLVIGALGLYGLLAYAVTQRKRELGLRMALGATGPRLITMVVREGLLLAAIGVAVGLPLAVATGRAARSLLFNVSPVDAASLLLSAGILLAAAFLASYIPASSAARIDLSEALRQD
jgi:predicted permease